jgi:hypothetical protein
MIDSSTFHIFNFHKTQQQQNQQHNFYLEKEVRERE